MNSKLKTNTLGVPIKILATSLFLNMFYSNSFATNVLKEYYCQPLEADQKISWMNHVSVERIINNVSRNEASVHVRVQQYGVGVNGAKPVFKEKEKAVRGQMLADLCSVMPESMAISIEVDEKVYSVQPTKFTCGLRSDGEDNGCVEKKYNDGSKDIYYTDCTFDAELIYQNYEIVSVDNNSVDNNVTRGINRAFEEKLNKKLDDNYRGPNANGFSKYTA